VYVPGLRDQVFCFMNIEEIITIIRSKKRTKSFGIKVISAENIVLTIPSTLPERQLPAIIKQATPWIQKQLHKKRTLPLARSTGPLYLGDVINEEIEDVEKYYRSQAKMVIQNIVETQSSRIGLCYKAVRFKKMKSRWGSCSSKKNLNFNIMLMQCPIEVIEYVVIHELCHLKEMNHSKDFWNLVQTYVPNYKTHRNVLKQYSLEL
jgi:predicted metal-dependent hydrolase